MPRPEAWRLDPASYPHHDVIQTRFQDLDVLGHINNVAMAGLWRQLDAVLARISAGEPAVPDEALVAQFATMYDAHIDAEENILLPALRRVVAAAEWNAIGRAMAERRGQERKEGA